MLVLKVVGYSEQLKSRPFETRLLSDGWHVAGFRDLLLRTNSEVLVVLSTSSTNTSSTNSSMDALLISIYCEY